MTEPWPAELMHKIDRIEEEYDIELVSMTHHEKWVYYAERLEKALELMACKGSPCLACPVENKTCNREGCKCFETLKR